MGGVVAVSTHQCCSAMKSQFVALDDVQYDDMSMNNVPFL